MKAELEQQHIHIEELEMETIKLQVYFIVCCISLVFFCLWINMEWIFLQKKLQLQNVEDSVGEAQHGAVIGRLENTMKELHTQIEQKSNQIESYAKVIFCFLPCQLIDIDDMVFH